MPDNTAAIKCSHCGETRRTWSLWRGFSIVPGADVVCCLLADSTFLETK